MFDTVIADFKCPYCGHEITKKDVEETLEDTDKTWQTKATACLLDVYKIGDELNFDYSLKIDDGWIEIHHVCPKCKKFVQAEIQVKNGRLYNKIIYKKEE